MIVELGHFALILSACVALAYGVLGIAGAQSARAHWQQLAVRGAQVQAALLVLAFVALSWAFASNDFSVLYVAQHSNSRLPMQYKLSAVWGGHEGSLLLWMLMLSMWGLAVSVFSKALPLAVLARVLGVMGLVAAGFLAFILFSSNPFERVIPAATDGRDLNPLLQDIGLILHPPMLYMGYVGFAVAFAFAVAALLEGKLDRQWARWARPWTTAAWISLTLGIALGSWWAYYELGWGGWWFWDPVENASLMPWLIGTALIHSLAVTEKRDSFKNWTLLLAIAAFSLSLLGTFLVRSGVLTSVHAFASDPKRGIFILFLLALVVGSSLVLFAIKAPQLGRGEGFGVVSRESLLLTNNVLLLVACATVLLGTLYPLIVDALGLGKLSVGPPYFNAVWVPIMAPMVFLMGAAPFAHWKNANLKQVQKVLGVAFASAAVISLVLPFVLPPAPHGWSPLMRLGLLLALWLTLATVAHVWAQTRNAGFGVLRQLPLHYWGMVTAHMGVAVFTAGVCLVGGLAQEQDLTLSPGQEAKLAGYSFRLNGLKSVEGANYIAMQGDMTVKRDNASNTEVAQLQPEKRRYQSSPMLMTEAAIHSRITGDIYVALGDPLNKQNPLGEWVVRLYVKPFVGWIWGGCVLMALGGLLAVWDKRYRRKA